jgi:hypothetical protein
VDTGIKTPEDLVGVDLSKFKVVLMTEVYRVDDDGLKTVSLGFFKDTNVATAFAGAQRDSDFHKTTPSLILTDGWIGVAIDQKSGFVKLFDDEQEALKLREVAIAKLSPAERKLLGF